MAAPPTHGHAGVQPQAGAAPEAVWMPFIQDLYPDLLTRTYFLPPLHFNRVAQSVQVIEGLTALVTENPADHNNNSSSSGGSRRRFKLLPPGYVEVAGRAFVENSPRLVRAVHLQASTRQDDGAHQRCLHALRALPGEVMVVVSSLVFMKYLNARTNPLHAAAIARLPTVQHPSVPPHIADGECDVLVIHRRYGLLLGEIKSVGTANAFFRGQTPAEQERLVVRQMEKAVRQLSNQGAALRHLVSDLCPPPRLTKTVLLPNLAPGQLRSALSSSPPLLQALCQTLSIPADVSQAVRHCLCQPDLQQPGPWWQRLHAAGPDPAMTDDVYQRLVARFCGPATTVDIPTAGPPRKVVRSVGEAVAETGLRYSSLTLTPSQVALLSGDPEPRLLYLLGPPGTGKTVVLLLKALQWVRQARHVLIVSGDASSRAVTTLIEAQLRDIVVSSSGTAAAATAAGGGAAAAGGGAAAAAVVAPGRIDRLCYDFGDEGFDAKAAVCSLRAKMGSGPVLVVFDEVNVSYRTQFLAWLQTIHTQLPSVSVWAAGVWKLDRTMAAPHPLPLPPWLQVHTVQKALRCPPAVTTELKQSGQIQANAIPQYHHDPELPAITQGPAVHRFQHCFQPGHHGRGPWHCAACADYVASVVRQLGVGKPGHPLRFKDVWILYHADAPSASDVMVQRLRQHHGLPVGVVTSLTPGQGDVRELALAVTDSLWAANWRAVQGLERRVVVALRTHSDYDALPSQSRSSSALYMID